MTAEERVRAKWPRAVCIDVCMGFEHRKYITTATGFNLGHGKSESEAWADAAKHLESEEQS